MNPQQCGWSRERGYTKWNKPGTEDTFLIICKLYTKGKEKEGAQEKGDTEGETERRKKKEKEEEHREGEGRRRERGGGEEEEEGGIASLNRL